VVYTGSGYSQYEIRGVIRLQMVHTRSGLGADWVSSSGGGNVTSGRGSDVSSGGGRSGVGGSLNAGSVLGRVAVSVSVGGGGEASDDSEGVHVDYWGDY
jgi:hypothetical protein